MFCGTYITDLEIIDTHIHEDVSSSIAAPQSFIAIIGGDFNIHRDDAQRLNLSSPSQVPTPSRVPPMHDNDNRLKRLLSMLVEIVQNDCFHIKRRLSRSLIDFSLHRLLGLFVNF